MRLLWDNFLFDAMITATNEDSSFPVSEIIDTFLEARFQATGSESVISIVFNEDKEVSAIAYGFTTAKATGNTWTLKDSGGTTISTGALEGGDETNMTFIDATVCRQVDLSFESDEVFYVGGVSIGDAEQFEYILADPTLGDLLRTESERTAGGQVLGQQRTSLVEWGLAIPHTDVTNDVRLRLRDIIREVGSVQPIYAQLYEDTDLEPAMYCTFEDFSAAQRVAWDRDFQFSFVLREAR